MTELTIGKQLSTLREKAGLSQIQLAEALGMTQQNISAYENDLHTPSPQRLLQIAQILNVPITELLCMPESITQPKPG